MIELDEQSAEAETFGLEKFASERGTVSSPTATSSTSMYPGKCRFHQS